VVEVKPIVFDMPSGDNRFVLTASVDNNAVKTVPILFFRVEEGGIILTESHHNGGATAINGIIQDGKILFKMQFKNDKTKEVSFEGAFESNDLIVGKYHLVLSQPSEQEPNVALEAADIDLSHGWSAEGGAFELKTWVPPPPVQAVQ